MFVAGREILTQFQRKHASAKKPLEAWTALATAAEWKTTADLKRDFPSASFLSGNRIVFNIGGNNFRLLVVAVFAKGRLLILRVGTHAEYDKWNL